MKKQPDCRKSVWIGGTVLALLLIASAAQAQTFGEQVPFADGLRAPRAYAMADFDGDGLDDVVGTFFGSSTIAWFKSDLASTPTLTAHPIASNLFGPIWVDAGDMDGDGDADAAAASFNGGKLFWYENTGAGMSWTEHQILTGLDGPKFVLFHDMDGDDDLDLIATVRNSNEIFWLENDLASTTTLARHDVANSLAAPQSAWPADLSGDGRPDLVVPGFGDNAIAWFEAPAAVDGTWQRHDVDLAAGGVRDLRLADLDKDGSLDILAALLTGDEVRWYENDGSASVWTPHAIISSYDGAAAVSVSDVDGDGDLDVASTAAFVNLVTWHENLGGASSWQHHTLSSNTQFPVFVLLADIDGDGDPDALSASNDDDVSAFHLNTLPVVRFAAIVSRDPNPADNIAPEQFTGERTIVIDLDTPSGNFLDAIHVSFDAFATSATIAVTGQAQIAATLPDADGPYTAAVRLSNLGYTGPSTTDTIVLDRAGPETEATGLASPLIQDSPVVSIAYTASDATTWVAAVQLYYRRLGAGPPAPFAPYGTFQANTGTITFDAGAIPGGGEGTYQFQTIGRDAAGNAEALNAGADATIVLMGGRDGFLIY